MVLNAHHFMRNVGAVMLLIALLFGVSVGTETTLGQTVPTATPSPTAVPTPTAVPPPPSGRTLLRRMQSATNRFATRREVIHEVIADSDGTRGILDSVTEVADKGERQHSLEVYQNQRPNRAPKITRSEAISVGNLQAHRSPGTAWDCIDWSKTLPGTQSITFTSSEGQGFPGRVRLLGTGMVGTVPVWRVRVTHRETINQQDFHAISTDRSVYSIAQTDYTLRQKSVDFTTRESDDTLRIRATIRYSDYGRAFRIDLPTACRRFHAPFAPLVVPLLAKATGLLRSRAVHLVVHYQWSQRGHGQISIVEHVDRLASGKGYRMTLMRSVTGPGQQAMPTVVRQQTVRVGGRVATWQTGRGWMCGVGPLFAPPHGPRRLPANANVVAVTVRDNTSAWRIHARYPSRARPGNVQATADVFISSFHPQMVRSVYRRVDRSTSPPVRITLAIDYSHYGERLHLRLPARCAGH